MTGFTHRIAIVLMVLIGFVSFRPQQAWAADPTRSEIVTDPALNNMKAYSVTMPAKWHFQGILMQGDDCLGNPFGVWRSTSPDGLSFMELMPMMGWRWGSGPLLGSQKQNSCLPLKGPMHAQEFLKYLASTMKVEYAGDEPIPAELNAKVQKDQRDADASVAARYAAMRVQPPKTTVELARASVRYKNGTFAMKGLLAVTVNCVEQYFPGVKQSSHTVPVRLIDGPSSTIDSCKAHVNYFTAPENQFAGTMHLWEAPGMMGHFDEAWQDAVVRRSTQRAQQIADQTIRQTNAMAEASRQQSAQLAAQRQSQAQEFNRQQAVRQQMHQEFLSTMQRGTDISMARTQQNMNARTTAASDWVDYALDRQTVVDPKTGQLNKVSSSYGYTWVDSTGKAGYQTNDPNANPNGVLPGTWTKQQVVHGNGAQ